VKQQIRDQIAGAVDRPEPKTRLRGLIREDAVLECHDAPGDNAERRAISSDELEANVDVGDAVLR
jgi:hypothetical protein